MEEDLTLEVLLKTQLITHMVEEKVNQLVEDIQYHQKVNQQKV